MPRPRSARSKAQNLADAGRWGQLPVGAAMTKGESLFPRLPDDLRPRDRPRARRRPRPSALRVETVDTHCHLDAMGLPVPEVIAAAQAVGVRRMVTVGDTMASSRWCAETAAAFADVYAAVAVHPNEVNDFTAADADELASLAAPADVRAIGETGLDYYWGMRSSRSCNRPRFARTSRSQRASARHS